MTAGAANTASTSGPSAAVSGRTLSLAVCSGSGVLQRLALVDDAHGLALGALDGLGLLELHRDLDVEHVVDLRLHRALEALEVAHRLGEEVLAHLDPDLDDVEVALAVDEDLVVRLDRGDAHQHLLDLAGEHVDAPDAV